jgi:hypothetical protein
VTLAPSPTTSLPIATPVAGTRPAIPVVFETPTTTRTVIVRPVDMADKRVVKRGGPVVIFLMHGMADNLGMKATGDAEDFEECAGPKDRPFYGRCEWGQDFLPGLFGSANVNAQLTTLDGRDVTGDKFIKDVMREPTDTKDFDETLGHRLTGDCVADPEKLDTFDPKIARHFIVPGPLKLQQSPFATLPKGIPPTPPQLAAFVTWRDPTRGMVFSGRRVTRQVYAALRWYEETYKITPGVILVAQSFGGLASRFMLSRPDPQSLNADTNRENVPLCKEDLAKMDYVRDRTLFLLTLATPHEGSYLAEWAPPVKNALRALLTELNQGLATSDLAKVLRGMATISTLVGLNLRPTIVEQAVSSINGFLPQLDSAAALIDMQLARMEKFNRGPIAPDKARRTAASPIIGAQKTLVPVYATLARSPGADAFDGPDLAKGFTKFDKKRAKARGWITQIMFVSDSLTRQLVPNGFGNATVAPYAPFQSILDRRARLFDASGNIDQIRTKFARDISSILSNVSPWFLGLFGNNAEAVVQSLLNDSAGAEPRITTPIHTSQKWKIGFDGTTKEVPIPVFKCGPTEIAIDLDVFARLLVDTYGKTPNVLAAITGKDLTETLQLIGVLIDNGDQFARAVAKWFVEKVKALGTISAECNTTPDNFFDIFASAEITNWRVVAGKGKIPVPVWIGTGEPVSDGEMDTDGAVHSASALGFTLAREPFFFEHDRRDDNGQLASWYRLHTNPVTEKCNHGLQYENAVGLWVRDAFLAPQVGPVPAADSFSVWPE